MDALFYRSSVSLMEMWRKQLGSPRPRPLPDLESPKMRVKGGRLERESADLTSSSYSEEKYIVFFLIIVLKLSLKIIYY